eukprot:gene6057-3530_t
MDDGEDGSMVEGEGAAAAGGNDPLPPEHRCTWPYKAESYNKLDLRERLRFDPRSGAYWYEHTPVTDFASLCLLSTLQRREWEVDSLRKKKVWSLQGRRQI